MLLLQLLDKMVGFTSSLTSLETRNYIILVMMHTIVWAVPAFIVLIYIFSEDGLLFSFAGLNELSLFMIWTLRDVSFIIHTMTLLYFWVLFFTDGFSSLYFWIAFLYSGLSSAVEYGAWIYGVDAIRYIDPNWDG